MAVFVGGAAKRGDGVNYVEYIQSTGTQHINTLFVANQDTRVVMDVQVSEIASYPWPFGSQTGHKTNSYGCCFSATDKSIISDFGTQQNTFSITSSSTSRMTIDKNKTTITVGGGSTTFSAQTFSSSCNLYLLARNVSDTSVGSQTSAKLYSCQIYDNGTLVRDFYPCYDPDGVACLYDKVEKKYYYNQGTGEFIAGEAA